MNVKLTPKILLEKYLNSGKINHNKQILKEKTLKSAHIYCLINNLPGSKYGVLLEKFFIEKFKMTKCLSSKNCGDYICNNGENIELKCSISQLRFNYVQIRINQKCNYLLTAYYLTNGNLEDLGELFIFKINKENMKNILLKYGSYAHGSKKNYGEINIEQLNSNSQIEYAIRPKYNSNCWKDLLKYRIDENEI